jgi:hypothetical protein
MEEQEEDDPPGEVEGAEEPPPPASPSGAVEGKTDDPLTTGLNGEVGKEYAFFSSVVAREKRLNQARSEAVSEHLARLERRMSQAEEDDNQQQAINQTFYSLNNRLSDELAARLEQYLEEELYPDAREMMGKVARWTHQRVKLLEAVLTVLTVALLGLVVLHILPPVGAEAIHTPTPKHVITFHAYDCGQPRNVTALSPGKQHDCLLPHADVEQEEAWYYLLQKVQVTRFKVKRCQVKTSRIVHVCRAMAHVEIYPQEWLFSEEQTVPTAVCLEKWDHGIHRDSYHSDRVYNLTVPGITKVITQPVGNSWVSNSGWSDCRGGNWRKASPEFWGVHYRTRDTATKFKHVVVVEHHQVRLEELDAIIDEENVVTLWRDQIKLPCAVKAKGCVVEDYGTLVWTPPTIAESCPYFRTMKKAVLGIELKDPDRASIFYSQEEASREIEEEDSETTSAFYAKKKLLKLEKREAISRCGGVLYRTDFSNLFLSKEEEIKPLNRLIPPAEMSVLTYVNQQDSFLYKELIHTIREHLEEQRERDCTTDRKKRAFEYARRAAEQHAVLEGETAMISPGQFVTASGEVWYSYHCRRLQVYARGDHTCYNAIPIQIRPADLQRYQELRGLNMTQTNITVSLFLEPRTHRIISVAAPVECGSPLLPMYQTKDGTWVVYDGINMYPTHEPLVLEQQEWEASDLQSKELDFEKGGVYSVEAVRKMERFSQAPRAAQGMIASLAWYERNSASTHAPGTPYQLQELFPNVPDSRAMHALDVFGWLWKMLEKYGRVCSIIVGTGVLYTACTWCLGVALRLFTYPITGNMCLHVATAFFPSLREFLKYPSRMCRTKMHHVRDRGRRPSQSRSRSHSPPIYNEVRRDRSHSPPAETKEDRVENRMALFSQQTAEKTARLLKTVAPLPPTPSLPKEVATLLTEKKTSP